MSEHVGAWRKDRGVKVLLACRWGKHGWRKALESRDFLVIWRDWLMSDDRDLTNDFHPANSLHAAGIVNVGNQDRTNDGCILLGRN